MSFYDSASLAFLPSGGAGKDGKAYSTKPRDGSGDFTFSRGSNLTATRVDSNGLIEKGRENLLLKSNLFDNGGVSPSAWLLTNGSVSSGQGGYDGSSDAWLFTATNTAANLKQSVSSSGVNTFSIYAKAGTQNGIFLRADGGDNPRLFFKLNTGTIGSQSGTIIDSSIESVGNGWYRVSLVVNVSITQVRIYVADDNNTFPSSGSIYIQDAQVEIGLTSTEYIESGATTGLAGLLEDSPRFDFSGGASCPSLILEPSRTNLITQSEYLEGYNQISNLSLDLTNETLSPEGLNNSYSLTATSTSALIRERINPLASGTYTFSFYAKYDSSQFIAVRNSYLAASFDSYVWFDIQNKTKGTTSGSSVVDYDIEDVGNGWVRCYVTTTSTSSGDSYFFIYFADSNGGFSTTIGNKLYLYGWQCEQGSYPTSYIPNHSGGSVTRNADVCDRGSELAYTGDYTLFMEFEVTKDAVYFLNNSALQYRFFFENDDAYFKFGSSLVFFQNMFNWVAALGTNIKMAIYKNGTDAAMFVNGTKYTPSTNTLTTGNESLSWRYLNYTTTADRQEQAYIKKLLEFEKALSNTDCEILTGTSYESFAAMATALNYTTYE